MNSSSQSRIGVLGLGFLAAALVVVVHLFVVMVVNHEAWAARSHRNRWAFRSVPSLRGAILDRHGSVLVHDEPTTQVSLFYLRFRLRHPVGAAVHGATTWARVHPDRELATYGYEPGPLGPRNAARDLLAIPVSALRRDELERKVAGQLATSLVTVMSSVSGMSRRRVFTALREASEQTPGMRCGEALSGFPEGELLRRYDLVLASLRQFEQQLEDARESGTKSRGLFERLEWARRASLEDRSLVEGGELIENMEWPVAQHVPFEMAAPLRVGTLAHPGIRVRPGVRRVAAESLGSSLRAVLGRVKDVGRAEPDERWIDRYLDREMPEEWLADMVPEEAAVSAEDRGRMQKNAEASFKRLTKRFERRGTVGIERAYDDPLTGRLGMRLVERDSQQREQLMWSSLRVESGQDIEITVDSRLQTLAERAVEAARRDQIRGFDAERDRERCRAAVAVIDAQSGDILALAGSPEASKWPYGVPGVSWSTNGSLGSLVKPFVLVEALQAETMGRPHTPLAAIEPCSQVFRWGGTTINCDHAHWDAAKDPIYALAASCNFFFFQAAVGLERDGVQRALQRFGLAPAAGTDFEMCWQGRVPGLRWTAPKVHAGTLLPRRAIGYDVESSPLAVARAYAGLATGRLPTLGFLHGENRKTVALDGIQHELDLVRRGLADCVRTGTAREVTGLLRYEVLGKTGTAEVVKSTKQNNAWFAGYLPWVAQSGVQLCFCAVIYWVPDGTHGATAAGGIIADLLERANADPELRAYYDLEYRGR